MGKGKIIGVISIKGGVGKTTTVANLAGVLANNYKKNVLAIDANFSAPNLGLHLGLIEPKASIHDVLLDKSKISDAIHEHEHGFHIIPASVISKKVNPFKLKQKIEWLKEHYDFILLDSSPSLNEEILSTMIASDELLVVSSPDIPTLSTTMRAVKLAKQKNTPITGLVLNKVRNKKFEIKLKDVETATNTPIVAVLPDDVRVLEALAANTPATIHKPLGDAAIEYRKLAAFLVGKNYKDTRFKSKVKNLFRKDIPIDEVNRVRLLNPKE